MALINLPIRKGFFNNSLISLSSHICIALGGSSSIPYSFFQLSFAYLPNSIPLAIAPHRRPVVAAHESVNGAIAADTPQVKNPPAINQPVTTHFVMIFVAFFFLIGFSCSASSADMNQKLPSASRT